MGCCLLLYVDQRCKLKGSHSLKASGRNTWCRSLFGGRAAPARGGTPPRLFVPTTHKLALTATEYITEAWVRTSGDMIDGLQFRTNTDKLVGSALGAGGSKWNYSAPSQVRWTLDSTRCLSFPVQS